MMPPKPSTVFVLTSDVGVESSGPVLSCALMDAAAVKRAAAMSATVEIYQGKEAGREFLVRGVHLANGDVCESVPDAIAQSNAAGIAARSLCQRRDRVVGGADRPLPRCGVGMHRFASLRA